MHHSKKALIGLFFSCLLSTAVLAQEAGRTDGPENTEVGKGGYTRNGSGSLSLQLDWGAAFGFGGTAAATRPGIPLFVGATASYWVDDWFLVDVSGAYLLSSGIGQLVVGPKFRTATDPISGFVSLKAGPFFTPAGIAFGVSGAVGGDLILNDHLLLGLGYGLDLVFAGVLVPGHRVFMNIGYRF